VYPCLFCNGDIQKQLTKRKTPFTIALAATNEGKTKLTKGLKMKMGM
jgi:hypothetical protein